MPTTDSTIHLQINGKRTETGIPAVPADLHDLIQVTQPLQSFEIHPTARAEGLAAETVEARPDDVLELELEGGYRIWMSVDEYRRAQIPPAQLRGEATPLPNAVAIGADFPGEERERGAIKWVVKGLKFLGVDISAGAARFIAGKVDAKSGKSGLYSVALTGDVPILTAPLFAQDKNPLLVFIHGTMSSTDGSFGGLWRERKDLLSRLNQTYGGHCYAFEHPTFTQSPIENAVALASALPDKAVLHLVSHSRGGMIGELLCRAERSDAADPFDSADFDLFAPAEQPMLRQLQAVLKAKKFRIERFIRVACPARGTTLASGRLDRWLSVLENGISALDRSEWGADVAWLITSIIKERTAADVMPGLQAMMPDSATVALLNRPKVEVRSDLRVIAGDYEGGGALGTLANWGVEAFFDSLNDVVVNTPSMYGGADRADRKSWYFFAEGPDIYHFSYFKNPNTAGRLADALAVDDPASAGFKPITDAPGKDVPIARGIVIDFFAEGIGAKLKAEEPSDDGSKPLLVLVPGIMGTHLMVKERIWVALPPLIAGKFQDLDVDNRDVTTDGVVKLAYGDFVDFISRSHEVLPFPYDWRLSLASEGKRFAGYISKVLKAAARNNRPVRIVAHSMGGLLVRMAAVLPEKDGGTGWWPSFAKGLGNRLLMAGTPNGGSWMVPLALTGRADIVKSLATIDLRHNVNDIINIARNFQGFLDMLPVDGGNVNAFAPQTWLSWKVAGEKWTPPSGATLAQSDQNRQLMSTFDFEGAKGILRYLAGTADRTPTVPAVINGRLTFGSTEKGDGRVLWSTGIPWPESDRLGRVWYLDASHGDLLDTEEAFKGISEILETGGTTLLSATPNLKTPPRGIVEDPWERGTPFYPDQAMLLRSALGSTPGRTRRGSRGAGGRLRVIVCHGDLVSARHPVAVGHYWGDTIYGGEAALDQRLNCVLSRRHRLGIYPGPEGTSEVFFNESGDWGAIVIGLGHVGDLNAKKLSETFAKALLEFATTMSKCVSGSEGFSISTILIGSGAGWGLGVRDSARALIEGAHLANTMLAELDEGRTFLQELEILELFEDRAIQALRAVRDLSALGIFSEIDIQPTLKKGDRGRRRPICDEGGGWWRRIKIELKEEALNYTVITGLARTEETVQPAQRCLVESLIAAAVKEPGVNERDMNAIYNLLTPNTLKDSTPDQGDLLLMLDEGAAGYPWEMMHVGDSGRREALALRAGFLRQLVLPSYRERVAYSVGTQALVVAHPQLPQGSPFPELPGAESEGAAVTTLLKEGGYTTESLIRHNTRDILGALFDKDYRILHLAGHGVYRFEKKRRRPDCTYKTRYVSGMVLDWMRNPEGDAEPVLFTAVEVKQLRRVPDIVFINCCYLGIPGPGEEFGALNGYFKEPNLFAASVAKEFIAMGVRAVIAAGWAVNDAAAKAFATSFYGAMLSGATFGHAVLGARNEAKKAGANSNTWAAYQCYGDPDYTLKANPGKEKPQMYLSPREAVFDIEGLAGAVKDDSGKREACERVRCRLSRIISTLPHEWLTREAEVREALGAAFADIGDYEAAVNNYQAALAAGGGSIKSIEQIFNLSVRLQENLADAGAVSGEEAEAEIQRLLDDFEKNKLPVLGRTPERCALIGSAYKRLLLAHLARQEKPQPTTVENWLAQLAYWYRKGSQIDGEVDPYNALNWATASIIGMYRHQGEADRVTALKEAVAKVKEKGKALFADNPGFWTGIYSLDADVCIWLLDGLVLAGLDKEARKEWQVRIEVLGAAYGELIDKFGSAREVESVLNQFRFLLKVLPEEEVNEVRGGIKKLKDQVQSHKPK